MHLRTLLFLLGAVALLGGLAYWLVGQDQKKPSALEDSLLEGFDRARVRALRVDNLERSLQLRVELDRAGEWQIVDPIRFPADSAVIDALLDSLAHQHARSAPAADAKKLGLDPPRVALEIEEQVGTELVTRRIEIGQVDLDDQWVFARSAGRIVRTERALDSTLERDLPDWRARSVLRFSPRDVVEVHRSGTFRLSQSAPANELQLDAVLDGSWKATAPLQAELDPQGMVAMIVAASSVRVLGFIDNAGGPEFYGLDRPRMRLEFVLSDGSRQALRMSPERGEVWYVQREDRPEVVRVSDEYLSMLARPTQELLDRQMVRVAHERLQRVVLRAEGLETTLTKSPKGWRVRAVEDGREVLSDDAADSGLVEDALGTIERVRLDALRLERTLSPDELRGSLRLETSDGDVQGGVFGPEERATDGTQGVLFRREGETLVALVDGRLYELARRAPASWRSLELHKLPEIEVARIEVSSGSTQRAFARDAKGKWVRIGSTIEAKEFAKLVDGVLSLRASELLVRDDQALENPLSVAIFRFDGSAQRFELGSRADAALYRSADRLAKVRPELAEALRAVLATE